MADKVQLIKEEIERRIKECSSKNDISEGALALDSLLDFIDSLPEEHFNYNNATIASKDFGELPEETLDEAAVRTHIELEESGNLSFINTFSKGAEWHEKQMMKDAVDATIFSELKDSDGSLFQVKSDRFRMNGVKISDKIKVIPIKTEQQ